MNSDSYFEIGSTHLVCQDYALSGNYKDMFYGIISDGCSSAEYSEIGASILCHGAKYCLALNYELFKERVDVQVIANILGNSILKRADDVRKIYPVPYTALQATLFIVVMIEGKSFIFGWGDGVIILQSPTGKVDVVEIDYPDTNAPFYLCSDLTAYCDKFGSDRVVRYSNYLLSDSSATPADFKVNKPYVASFDGVGPSSITICSDGLTQYQNESRSGFVKAINMIPQIIDYPNLKGEFVKRTMNFLRRDLSKKNWSHADDVSVATVVA